MPTTLRRLVEVLALLAAVAVAIAVPASYFGVAYSHTAETLSFWARLNAGKVAQYIYAHDVLWQYQVLRIEELIQLPGAGERQIYQKIYDDKGELVLEKGPALMTPVIARRVPIMVSGAPVGSLVVEASLWSAIRNTELVAVLGVVLGIFVYGVVRVFPLRALDRTLIELHATERSLAQQNERFDAALTNMSQGLCMFDAEAKLVLFNPRFAEIFGIPPEKIVPGLKTPELMALSSRFGGVKDVNAEETLALQQNLLREGKPATMFVHLSDNRTIAISHRRMPNGGFVATFEDITQRIQAEERIRHLAQYDALTDLPNRVSFYEQTESILAHLRRNESVAVLSLDLDRFKSVNDMFGHPIGDKLLQEAAARMRSCIREEDMVARLGGDEFAVIQVPSDPPPSSRALAARLTEVVGAPYDIDGHQLVVGTSVGIAIAPGDGDKADVLMKNADLALYRAKADGGGVYRFFELEMDARMQKRRLIELGLRKAILNNEFELLYQPIVDVKSGRIKSCEALIRWHHPERGMVPPMEFIPVAEETGLIAPIGDWVLRQACAAAVHWPSDIGVAVNLSPAQFKSRNIVQTVAAALAESGLPPARLELEITELVLLEESEGAFAILRQLRDLGIRIAMDDFGSGYSSLGYLRSFPFDKIKIDKSFIQDIATKEDSVAIVRAVVGLSSSLGITTTAEGVENKDQLSRVTSEGCNEVQGDLFSPPRPAAEIKQLFKERAAHGDTAA
jgi:diguanylate cyclase (GGDEF)-like protein/PAS domain S-box-containing protein